MKRLWIFSSILLVLTESFSQTPKITKMVTLNGTDIYYEVHGKGEPLFLLHGFTQSSKSWYPLVGKYDKDFEVYLVDLKGHGKSSPYTGELSIRAAAADLQALIEYLDLDNIHAIGFSYGGDILFQLALLRPRLIKSMISIGACGTWHAKDFPDFVEYLSYKNIANLPWMHEQQTSEKQVRSILEQIVNYNVSLSDEELKSINTNVLFVFGDEDDSVPLEQVARARKYLPHSFLWILPNTGHSAHKDENTDEFIRVSKDFFKTGWHK